MVCLARTIETLCKKSFCYDMTELRPLHPLLASSSLRTVSVALLLQTAAAAVDTAAAACYTHTHSDRCLERHKSIQTHKLDGHRQAHTHKTKLLRDVYWGCCKFSRFHLESVSDFAKSSVSYIRSAICHVFIEKFAIQTFKWIEKNIHILSVWEF